VSDYQHLVGHRFPGGTYTLQPFVSWLWADCAMTEQDAEAAHPSLGYFVAMQGLGASIQDVFDLMEATVDSGVMFGETELEFSQIVRAGVPYDVTAEIVGVERKAGKRAGIFDKLTFEIRVADQRSGEHVVTNTNTWIFPRKEA
jgi:hypothetical protein